MAFKTDTIRLKNYSSDGAITDKAQGDLAVVSDILKYYNGSAWAAVDTVPAFTQTQVNTSNLASDVTIASGTNLSLVTYYNTGAQGSNAVKIKKPVEYNSNARVEIINGSSGAMTITKFDSGDPSFNWEAGTGSVTTVAIGLGQRALFLRPGTSTTWEVVVLSL